MKTSPKNNPILSIVILNYNSKTYLSACLQSIAKSTFKDYEIIVVDNASNDNSIALAIKDNHPNTKYFLLKTNRGFASGNNQGIAKTNPQSPYILFLNPDTTIETDTLKTMVDFMKNNRNISASTCRLILAKSQKLQPECHRGFPTPWRSFCHFSGLEKIFSHNRIFNGYFLGHLNLNQPHPIEACVGAFLLLKREVGNKIGWWCEDYFFYGDDLDLCYQLYKNKYQLWFNPATFAIHFQGISSGIKKHSSNLSSATRTTKTKIAKASTQAMRIFYQRNYFNHYSAVTKIFVNFGINLLELFRVIKAKYF